MYLLHGVEHFRSEIIVRSDSQDDRYLLHNRSRSPVVSEYMKSQTKKTFIKLSLSVLAIVFFISPCYPESQPNGDADTAAMATSRLLQSAIDLADEVILYSLAPERADVISHPGEHHSPEYLAKLFNGYIVLGQARIDDARERRALVDSLCQGLADSPREVELCFDPHHGLRIRKGSQNLDVVICFQCHQIQLNGSSPFIPISRSPQGVFDSAVQKAHLPVSK